jgi:acyl-CoA thioesterase
MTAPVSPVTKQNSTNSTFLTPEKDLSSLSDVQQQVVAALAEGRTITAAAAEVQLHRATIHNWLKDIPAFKTALKEAKSLYAARLRDEMTDLSATALDTVRTVLQDAQSPTSVRLRAALAILQRQDWRLPADAEPNLDYQIKQQLLALGSDPFHPGR